MLRLAVDSLRVMGRATQGVRLINLRDDDSIASVAKIENGADEEKNAISEISEDVINNGVGLDENSVSTPETDNNIATE